MTRAELYHLRRAVCRLQTSLEWLDLAVRDSGLQSVFRAYNDALTDVAIITLLISDEAASQIAGNSKEMYAQSSDSRPTLRAANPSPTTKIEAPGVSPADYGNRTGIILR